MIKERAIGFKQVLNIIGGKQGAVYSEDKKGRIKEIVFMGVDEDGDKYYYKPTEVQTENPFKIGKFSLFSDGTIA